MAKSKSSKEIYEFGRFALDPAERQLRLAEVPVPLEPKAFDTLVALVERRGRLVEKAELLQLVWPDTFIEEVNLARNISALRKVLAQDFAAQPCIETVPKHGYRFVAEVSTVINSARPAPPAVIFEQTTASLLYEEEIVTKCAPATVGQLHLSRRVKLALGLLALCLAAGGGALWQTRRAASTPAVPALRSLAVLPFRPLDAASSEPYLEIGVADTLITRLSHLSEIIVRPTSAIRRYAERETDTLAAGRALAVEAVLEGSLQRRGDRLRVTVRLLRVADGKPLWAHQCDVYCTDIFQTQDTVARQVAEALRPNLSAVEQQALTKRGTNDPEAYQLYLKGLYFFNKRQREAYEKAIECFHQAIARDPSYALAYNGLAHAQGWLSGAGGPKAEASARQQAALTKALELDAALPEVHATLGLYAMNLDWDWATAEREFQLALQLNPNYATAHHWYGEYLFLLGRFDEGLRELRRAQEIDPLSLIINSDIAKCYYFARQYEQAIAQAHRTLELDANFIQPYYWLFAAYYAQGRLAEALAVAAQVRPLDDVLFAEACFGMAQASLGNQAEAQRVLAVLRQTARRRYVSPAFSALVYSALGDTDRAFEWLEQAYTERTVDMIALKEAPAWDSLRAEPRFQELLRRMHFPD